jgi:hypothetical protein
MQISSVLAFFATAEIGIFVVCVVTHYLGPAVGV